MQAFPHHNHDAPAGVTIRLLGTEDLSAVTRLSELDAAPVPEGQLLGAEVAGRLAAMVSLTTGESVADPFARTGELRALLELRAAQLRGREKRARFRPHVTRPARATLAGSPPGAGGKLLTLPIRPY